MTFFKVLALFCFAAIGHGVALSDAHAADEANTPEQRRAELRAALKAKTGHATADLYSEATPASLSAKRHLSDLERADLRRQLRQQRRASKSDQP